tara:strand:+ start:1221 stop:1442 length:222 start_codon:yes stop_codon:yes gene_type:complete
MKAENELALKIAFEMNEWQDCLLVIEEVIKDEHQSRVNATISKIDIQLKIAKDLDSPKGEIEILEWFKQLLKQ